MARRYSGSVVVNCVFVDARDEYKCSVKTPSGRRSVRVRPPRALKHAVDSPKAYDETAHAALSFVDSDHPDLGVSDYADYTGSGWSIQRRKRGR